MPNDNDAWKPGGELDQKWEEIISNYEKQGYDESDARTAGNEQEESGEES